MQLTINKVFKAYFLRQFALLLSILGLIRSLKPHRCGKWKYAEAIDVLLVNIFGGITRCDDVAKAVVEVRDKLGLVMPFVVRLVGTKQKEGMAILKKAGMNAFTEMEPAVKRAVEIAKSK